jgi:hypothetical protein
MFASKNKQLWQKKSLIFARARITGEKLVAINIALKRLAPFIFALAKIV